MRVEPLKPIRAFTLVELLVVIGIIATLIGVLLPVLSSVAARGRDLQCQSNIRQCVQLILAYAAENKGQLPYGYYYARGGGNPEGWGPDPNGEHHFYSVTVWSILSQMSWKGYALEAPHFNSTPAQQEEAARNAAPILRCPEAMQVYPHLASYAGNLNAFVTPYMDAAQAGARRDGMPWQRLIERQTVPSRLFGFTAIIWDTSVTPAMANEIGYIIGGDIDGQRIWQGAVHPQYRFYSAHDPFARFPPGIFGNNKPVQLNVGITVWRNIDPPPAPNRPDEMPSYPYQGNLRFRHNKNTTCNAGFADGHVEKFTGKFKRDGSLITHDALRKHFLIKWPRSMGIAPDPALPH